MSGILNFFNKKAPLAPITSYDPEIRQVADPDVVILPLEYPGQVKYHATVAKGDIVKRGQAVAKSTLGNAVIASISGTVRGITTVWTAQSVHSPAIIIDRLKDQSRDDTVCFSSPVAPGDLEAAMMRMREAGVAPPWSLSGREWKDADIEELPRIETIIITGIRQEDTVLTSQILLDQQREKVAEGLKRIGQLMPGSRVFMTAPQTFKPWADSAFASLAELHYLPTSYYGRIEREVVSSIIGKRIPNRESYRKHGIIVLDVEYLIAIVDALNGTSSLTHKHITITGTNIEKPITVRFPIGSSLQHVLASQDLTIGDYTRPVVGGPMKGVAQYSDNTPLTYYNGIHLIAGEVAPFDAIAPCINCGRCTRACPVNIQVHLVNRMIEFGQLDSAKDLNPEACHECGMCAFVCPAERPIVQLMNFCNHDMVHGERFTWAAGGLS